MIMKPNITFKEWLQFTVNEITETYAERFPLYAQTIELGGVCFMQEFRMQELKCANMLVAFNTAVQKINERGDLEKMKKRYTYSDWAKEISLSMQAVIKTVYRLE